MSAPTAHVPKTLLLSYHLNSNPLLNEPADGRSTLSRTTDYSLDGIKPGHSMHTSPTTVSCLYIRQTKQIEVAEPLIVPSYPKALLAKLPLIVSEASCTELLTVPSGIKFVIADTLPHISFFSKYLTKGTSTVNSKPLVKAPLICEVPSNSKPCLKAPLICEAI